MANVMLDFKTVIQYIMLLYLTWVFLSPIFWGISMYSKKPNSAKLVMQVSIREGAPEPMWNQAVSFFMK